VEDSHGAGTTFGDENLGQLVVVVGHHASLSSPLGSGVDEKAVNVFDGTESLLPKFEFDRVVQLNESKVEVSSQGVDIGKVDGKGLIGVLLSVLQLFSDLLAQSSELATSVVDFAEVKRLQGNVLEDKAG
jgi:hypothetical protein